MDSTLPQYIRRMPRTGRPIPDVPHAHQVSRRLLIPRSPTSPLPHATVFLNRPIATVNNTTQHTVNPPIYGIKSRASAARK